MKKYIYHVIIGLVILSSLGMGSKETKSSGEKQALKVAMELQYPPFEMQDADGNPTGVTVDMVNALGEYLGRPVEIQNTAWTGLIPSLQTGKVDIIASSMTITEERQKVIDFSIPYAQSGLSLLINKNSPVQGIEDFSNPENVITSPDQIIRLGVRSGTIAADYAKKHKLADHPNVEIINQDTPAAQLLEVIQGKIDAVMYDPLTLIQNYENNKDTTRMNLNPVEAPGPWGIAVKKGNTELLEQVNAFIKDYRAKGGFDRLADKYLSDAKRYFEEGSVPFFFDVE